MTTIRDAKLEDIPRLVDLSYEMFKESQFAQYNFNPIKMAKLFKSYIELPTLGIAIVAEQDGEVVGAFLGGVAEHFFGDTKQSYDLGLFVSAENRTSMIGWLLLKEYIKRAKELGADEIQIANSTGVDTEKVVHLFERAGLVKYGYVFRMNVGS